VSLLHLKTLSNPTWGTRILSQELAQNLGRGSTQSIVAPGTTVGSSANQVNYNNVFGRSTDVGSFSGSGSFYGTFDQSGNVYQWNDMDGTPGSNRGLRGGSWSSGNQQVSFSKRLFTGPSIENKDIGFRLASPA
jgi:formylglycine-generating enzyme required for sulfatase activity